MLTIIISTLEDRITRLNKAVQIQHPSIRYLIIHQARRRTSLPNILAQRPDIAVVTSLSRGIAVSRNIGLRHCETRYALIADDDVEFLPSGLEKLLQVITSEKPDFALFKIKTPNGQPEYKIYPDRTYAVSKLKHWVSSIEIMVNADKVKAEKLWFDERFGLGTKLGYGEEEIFVTDMIRNGWEGSYFPTYIVVHPFESSGKQERARKKHYFFQGAFDRRTGKRRTRKNNLVEYIRRPRLLVEDFYYLQGNRYIHVTGRTALPDPNPPGL